MMLAKNGANDDALTHFREAVAYDPQFFAAHLGLANLALKTEKHQLAVTHYALAVEIDPRSVTARKGHVVALTKAGKHADAVDSLQKSLELLPDNLALAHIAARLSATCPDDRFRDGPNALKLALAVFRSRKSIEHGETLAMAYAETGDYDMAKQWQNKAIELATSAKRDDLTARLKNNLALYESGKPCRTPW